MLPPIPGYIPVYIQHGDVPPEDPYHYAQIFQVADRIAPPRVSATMNFPTTTTEMSVDITTHPPTFGYSSTTVEAADDTNQSDVRVNEQTTTEISSNTIDDTTDDGLTTVYQPENNS